ncbi:hypothetical protein R9C00_00530 [Flammeovirgaceae bacterium SG7u.111]|nr:hypothetical protein [Flammeovirgaceae bacterium SG7u.132]WPO35935.1 hypothetical protein R9C00_00530 [Flammeovirgaceae bacterium SG7u.111]
MKNLPLFLLLSIFIFSCRPPQPPEEAEKLWHETHEFILRDNEGLLTFIEHRVDRAGRKTLEVKWLSSAKEITVRKRPVLAQFGNDSFPDLKEYTAYYTFLDSLKTANKFEINNWEGLMHNASFFVDHLEKRDSKKIEKDFMITLALMEHEIFQSIASEVETTSDFPKLHFSYFFNKNKYSVGDTIKIVIAVSKYSFDPSYPKIDYESILISHNEAKTLDFTVEKIDGAAILSFEAKDRGKYKLQGKGKAICFWSYDESGTPFNFTQEIKVE